MDDQAHIDQIARVARTSNNKPFGNIQSVRTKLGFPDPSKQTTSIHKCTGGLLPIDPNAPRRYIPNRVLTHVEQEVIRQARIANNATATQTNTQSDAVENTPIVGPISTN